MRVSLNCLMKRSQSGSGSSRGSSLGPLECRRASASVEESPVVRDVASRSAVVAVERTEYEDVIDCFMSA